MRITFPSVLRQSPVPRTRPRTPRLILNRRVGTGPWMVKAQPVARLRPLHLQPGVDSLRETFCLCPGTRRGWVGRADRVRARESGHWSQWETLAPENVTQTI